MATLKAIVQIAEKEYLYCIWYEPTGFGFFKSSDNGGDNIFPIKLVGCDEKMRRTTDDTWYYVLSGYVGGDIYYGETYQDCIDFLLKSMRRHITQIIEE
jgi:hypothetical protein